MKKSLYVITIMIAFFSVSCKKDEGGSGLKAVFSYVADGYKVNFTNFSMNAKTYAWDFGDGSTDMSNTKSPQHIFTKKGDFLVSLTASDGIGTSTFTDTVTVLGPNIKIDNDLTDWQYVGYSHVNGDAHAGTLRAVKTFASSTDIFFYLEGTADMAMSLFDMYIDADDNSSTGYLVGLYGAGSGADYLLEGPSGTPSWGSVFTHSGAQTDFSFTPVSTFDAEMFFGPLKTEGGKKVMEFSVKKSALGVSSGAVNFAIFELSTGWAELGRLPEGGSAESTFVNVPL